MEPILALSLEQLRATRTSVKWQVYGPDVVPAWVAEMDSTPCPAVVEAVTRALERGDTGYTWVEPFAAAVARFAEDRWDWQIDPATTLGLPDVMIGVWELLQQLTDPGGPVVVSPPVYNAFFDFIAQYGRRVVRAPLTSDGRLDPVALRAGFAEATSNGERAAYLLSNPHNPTGTVHTREELAGLASLAAELGVAVIADEVHAPLVYAGSRFTPYLTVHGGERGISLLSGSKGWNLAGLRCALAVPGTRAGDLLARVPEVATHGAGHLSAIAQAAAFDDGREWLDALVTELDVNRRHLAARLAAELPEADHRMPAATYLAWVDLRATGIGDLPAQIVRERAGVALGEGATFGVPGCVRVNFATSPQVLDEVIDRLVAGVRGAIG